MMEPSTPRAGDPGLELTRRMSEQAPPDPTYDRALDFAALSGRFAPEDAIRAAGIGGFDQTEAMSLARLSVVARLSDACDTRLWHPLWIMRAAARARRIAVLKLMDLSAQVAWRRGREPCDDVAKDICDALLGTGPFSPAEIRRVLADEAPDRATCERLLRGLTFAAPPGDATGQVAAMQAALARAEARADPENRLVETAIFGRDREQADIEASIRRQLEPNRRSARLDMLYIGGIGGIGKSTLLAWSRKMARQFDALPVLLDFDRPGIEGGDALGLSCDLARQVAELVGAPAAGLYAAIDRATLTDDIKGESFAAQASNLAQAIADVVGRTGRPLLLTLDTLESLTQHGDSAAFSLLEWLRHLKRLMPRLAILAAGRTTLPKAFARDVEVIHLGGLTDAAAGQLLAALKVTGRPARDLMALARGNPLVLRLGARLVSEEGAAPFSGISERATAQMQAGQLYRLILSRIPSPELRAIAHPGLLLRQINVDLLVEVVAPQIGLDGLTTEAARDYLDQLKRQAWLVEEEGEWLVHRADLRAVLLDLQIAENPARARALFAKAAKWHEQRGQALLALYYRLQNLRWRARPVAVDPALASAFTRQMIEELPRKAQDQIALARGERSSMFRDEEFATAAFAGEPGPSRPRRVAEAKTPKTAKTLLPDFGPEAAGELRLLMRKRNFAEAAAMVRRAGNAEVIDPASQAGATMIEALWRAALWPRARRMLAARLKALGPGWVDANHLELAAVLADLGPARFRIEVKRGGDWVKALVRRVSRQRDDSDWDMAGLLLRAGGHEVSDCFGEDVWRLWADGLSDEKTLATMWDSLLRSRGRPQQGSGMLEAPSRVGVMQLLLIDPSRRRMVQDWVPAARPALLGLVPDLAAAVIAAAGGEPVPPQAGGAATFEVNRADERGLLDHLLTALATLPGGAGLRDIAAGARRRAATVAGHWSCGQVPPGWRQEPVDRRLGAALTRYQSTHDLGDGLARADIARWKSGYGTGAGEKFGPMVHRAETLARTAPLPLLGTGPDALQTVALRLAEAGMPLPLVPPFAILTGHASPLLARPSGSSASPA